MTKLGFRDYLTTYSKIIAWPTAGALALPLAVSAAHLDPPWPDGVPLLTGILQLALVIISFDMCRSARRSTRLRVAIVFSGVLACCWIAYFFAYSLLVYEAGPHAQRFLRGFQCTSAAKSVFQNSCPLLSLEQIRQDEFKPEVFWTIYSITAARMLLLLLWLTGFGSLSMMVGSVIGRWEAAGP